MVKGCFELNKEMANKSIAVKDYEDLFVGFEFENLGIPASKAATHFGVTINSYGKNKEKKKVDLGNGTKIEFDVDVDGYEKIGLVTDVDRDPTVESEIITRPVSQKQLRRVKEQVFDWITENGGDMFANGKGGLHMTYVMDHHQKFSKFNDLVVKNFVQLTRAYYKEMMLAFAGSNGWTRQLRHRTIPYLRHKENLGQGKPVCVLPRRREDSNGSRVIWGVEVRFPDGTNDWNKVVSVDRFIRAMWRQSAIISRYGLIDFPQEVWDEQLDWHNNNVYGNESGSHRGQIRVPKNNPRFRELCDLLKPSLDYFGWGFVVNEEKEALYEKAIELQLQGKGYTEIAKEMGYSANSTIRVKAILNSGGM